MLRHAVSYARGVTPRHNGMLHILSMSCVFMHSLLALSLVPGAGVYQGAVVRLISYNVRVSLRCSGCSGMALGRSALG